LSFPSCLSITLRFQSLLKGNSNFKRVAIPTPPTPVTPLSYSFLPSLPTHHSYPSTHQIPFHSAMRQPSPPSHLPSTYLDRAEPSHQSIRGVVQGLLFSSLGSRRFVIHWSLSRPEICLHRGGCFACSRSCGHLEIW
jgi:hypothetical protein